MSLRLKIVFIVISTALVALLVAVARVDRRTGSPGSHWDPYGGFYVTLREIEAAKEQFAFDHKKLPGTVVSREQLQSEYFKEKFWMSGAEYVINPIGVYPEAVLTSRFKALPSKTIIRLETNSFGILHYGIYVPLRTND